MLTCGIFKKNGKNEPVYTTEIESKMWKTNILLSRRQQGGVGG